MLYWPGVRLRWLDICIFIDPAFLSQGCALRKIEGSPALWTCEIQCAQQMISVKKQRFSSRPGTKVTDAGTTGHRAQPWSWSIKMQNWMRPIFSHLERTSLVNKIMNHYMDKKRTFTCVTNKQNPKWEKWAHLACLATWGSSWTFFVFSMEVVFQD